VSIERLKTEHAISTSWIHFPLHPKIADEGMPVRDLFPNRDPEDMKAMGNQMRALMEQAGLVYGKRDMTYNSRLAQELGSWADTQEGGSTIHDRLFKAYFVDNVNIGDKHILLGIAEDSGLDGDQARDVLDHRLFSPQVTADWQRAWENGITGVPTFTSQELYVVGNQPYDVLLRFINHLRELNAEK